MTAYSEPTVRALLTGRGAWPPIFIVEVGSSAIGVSSSTTDDDLDLTAVYFEPDFHTVLWRSPDHTDPQLRTQPEGHRSRFGDIDINVYTLRRFAQLMLKANPSILGALYSPKIHHDSHILHRLRELNRSYVAARHPAGDAYLGYMTQQIERWQGTRGQKNVSRPELVEKYGYDTKYAYHAVRLGMQGIEYMNKGKLTLPPEGSEARMLLDIREGRTPESQAILIATEYLKFLKVAVENSPLPERANAGTFLRHVTELYKMFGPVPTPLT